MPTSYFVKTYGGQPLGNAVASFEESVAVRSQVASSVNRGGRYSAGTVFDALMLTLSGDILGSDVGDPNDPSTVRTAWDGLKAVLKPGPARQLLIDSDRYVNAEVSSDIKSDRWTGVPARKWTATLTAYDDPPWWSVAVSTLALPAGATAVATQGSGSCAPVISVPVSAPGGSLNIADANGQTLTLTPDTAGTYVVDSVNEIVTLNGVDKTGNVTGGDFLALLAGQNTLTLTATGGFAFSACSVRWQDRWY